MKTIIRIPTTQYAYLEFQFEGTAEEAITEHNRILNLYNGGFGLPDKQFNAIYDALLNKGEIEGDPGLVDSEMSVTQRGSIQDLKRALKRVTYQPKRK